jgi:hypothetical protein
MSESAGHMMNGHQVLVKYFWNMEDRSVEVVCAVSCRVSSILFVMFLA